MSKKHKDRGARRLGGSQAATGSTLSKLPMPEPDTGADGFKPLQPKTSGGTAFNEFMKKRSKRSPLTTTMEMPVAYADYDPGKADAQINRAIEFIKKDKFGKAYDALDKVTIDELIDAFTHMGQDLSNANLVNLTVCRFLQVCKSFYEYDKKQREIIPNADYDGVLAKYLSLGLDEPTGIVPNNSKKTDIKYPSLHNNMDKAYILKEGELVPEGVKETDSVEGFLKRVYDAGDLKTTEEIELELSPKIDGVSVNGTMIKACLVDPQTRGDQDASMSIKHLSGIELGDDPKQTDEFGIQFEAFVLDDDRIKAAEHLKLAKPYVSNRHAAAGIINRLCTNEDDELLEFLSFYPIEAEGLDGDYLARVGFLQDYGCVPKDMIKRKVVKGDLEKLLREIRDYFGMLAAKREKLSYSIDGMVITVVDEELQKACGRKSRTNKYQIGYKFDPANAEATVKGLYLDSGRKGYRTIQIELEHPVFLDGVRYDHVPVLSLGLFEKLNLREGSLINVHRVGDVIPAITVIKEGSGKKLSAGMKCPDCGEPLVTNNKKLMCQNPNCKGNIIGKYLAFLNAIGVDGYAEAFLEELIQHLDPLFLGYNVLLCQLTVDDMKRFGMTDKLSMEFPEKVAAGLAVTPDYVILGAMGWPDIGPARARELLKGYGGLRPFVKGFDAANMPLEWKRYLGEVGRKTANYITKDILRWNRLCRDLCYVANNIKNITTDFSERVKVGHTGLRLSDETIQLCEDLGMEITHGSNFDILITARKDRESKKMEIAQKRNLPIYLEEEFVAEHSNK